MLDREVTEAVTVTSDTPCGATEITEVDTGVTVVWFRAWLTRFTTRKPKATTMATTTAPTAILNVGFCSLVTNPR